MSRRILLFGLVSALALAGGAGSAIFGVCGPFTDVTDAQFCPFVLEIFTLGITTGLTPTTYDPTSPVSRLQMAAFLSRTVDGVLKRGGRRAALDQFWTTQNSTVLGLTTVGTTPHFVKSDGADLWVGNFGGASISRVRASDGKNLETWTGATSASGVLVAMGKILVTGRTSPGQLYRIDPTATPGAVDVVASTLGNNPTGIAFDGARIWTGNLANSVSIVTPGATIPWTVTTVAGFGIPLGVLYDGANVWIADASLGAVLKLDAAAAILQTVTTGSAPQYPIFDGTNIWVPNSGGNSVSVVRSSNGAVLATLTGNGLSQPESASFDGERVLVTNNGTNTVSLWKAADLTVIGTFGLGGGKIPFAGCSDGINFWIALSSGQLARF